MSTLYELAVVGAPTDGQIQNLETCLVRTLAPFGLQLNREVAWHVRPEAFTPPQRRSAAAAFFGASNVDGAHLAGLLRQSVPVVPVASSLAEVRAEIPPILQPLNCLAYDQDGPQRVATALLECIGLLPRQRRIFLSYRRDEAREAALQLFDAFSARQFDVFLDTHGVPPAEDFQAMLWHRLCDADVLVMLDTPTYFQSRWTSAEFGRALAKGISVLRVGWPDATPSIRTATVSRAELLPEEVDPETGRLAMVAVERLSLQLEQVRSESQAVRRLNLVSNVRNAIETIGGQMTGVGMNNAIHLQLPDGRPVLAYPTVGVPTSSSLHDATLNAHNGSVAVVYDAVGLHPAWQGHLDWLGDQIRTAQWIKAAEVAWRLADWEGKQ